MVLALPVVVGAAVRTEINHLKRKTDELSDCGSGFAGFTKSSGEGLCCLARSLRPHTQEQEQKYAAARGFGSAPSGHKHRRKSSSLSCSNVLPDGWQAASGGSCRMRGKMGCELATAEKTKGGKGQTHSIQTDTV